MKRLRPWAAGLLAVVTVAAALSGAAEDRKAVSNPAENKAAQPRPRVTISREITLITWPVREDGYPDYVAALNEIASRGVTRENNAAVLLAQAFGPVRNFDGPQDGFFRPLGIPTLPEKGQYFEEFPVYFERKRPDAKEEDPNWGEIGPSEIARRQIGKATLRPWSKEEFPELAAWLQENARPLELVLAGTKRPRFYIPFRGSAEALFPLRPWLWESAEAGDAMCARAMLRVQSGKVDDACQELLACHRLARLVGEEPHMLGFICAARIEAIASKGDCAVAHYGNLTGDRARAFAEQLRNLRPMRKLAEVVDCGDRLMCLDALCMFARSAPEFLDREVGVPGDQRETILALARFAGEVLIDWDACLYACNGWYDRLAAALARPTYSERAAALAKYRADLRRIGDQVRSPRAMLAKLLSGGSPRTTLGRLLGDVCGAILTGEPSTREVSAEDRTIALRRMVEVAFAMAAYRAEHRSYPADLGRLMPKYLEAVPEDPFSGRPLRYKREGIGYLLYSVGPNGQDDDGRESSVRDPKTDQELEGDDVVIRMPVPKKAGP